MYAKVMASQWCCCHLIVPKSVSHLTSLVSAAEDDVTNGCYQKQESKITQYEVAQLFGEAYSCIASVEKCKYGFTAAGIVPLNIAVFSDEDFAAVDTLLSPKSANSSTGSIDPKLQKFMNLKLVSQCNKETKQLHSVTVQEVEPETMSESTYILEASDLGNTQELTDTTSAVHDSPSAKGLSLDSGRVSVTGISPFC